MAHAECKVVLSFAATNNSIAWGEAIPGFKDAGVPHIPTPEGKKSMAMDYHEAQARHLARKTASEHDAQFLYVAPTGGGGFLYLAIYNFELGEIELGEEDEEKRLESVKGFNREMAETPDNVRLFLLVFSLLENNVYTGSITLEILDKGKPEQSG